MAIIGYIRDAYTIKDATKHREKMCSLGCYKIYEDDTSRSRHRLQWRYILENKTNIDTIVICKLSNALGGWTELPMFLSFCKKNRIRLISLMDKLDTEGILFNTEANDILHSLESFGLETFESRPRFTRYTPVELTGSAKRQQKKHEKTLLEKNVVNDYLAGVNIEHITQNRGVPENTLYRILRRYGVDPCRCVGKGYSKKK